MDIELSSPILARGDLAVVPGPDRTLPLERSQMRQQLLEQGLVVVGV